MRPSSSIFSTSLAMPPENTSQPMKPVAGFSTRLAGQMLAAAIADLEHDLRRRAGKERVRVERLFAEGDLERGRNVFEQPVLPLVQALARAAPEEGARLAGDVQRVVGFGGLLGLSSHGLPQREASFRRRPNPS